MAATAPETVADAGQFLVGEAGAVVGDDDGGGVTDGGDGHLDGLLLGRELHRVVDDRVQRAGQRDRVGPRGRGRAVADQAYALGLGGRGPGREAFGGELADVGDPQVRLGVLGQRQVQQVVQDLREALALGLDGGDLLVALGQFEGEQLDAQQQRRERVAQLVRGVGDEGALLLQHVLDVVRHLVERPGQTPELWRSAGGRDPGLEPPGGDVVGGGVEDPYGLEHPAGQPQGGADGQQHRGALARADDQPAVQGARAHLPGGRVGDHDRDDVTVPDDR